MTLDDFLDYSDWRRSRLHTFLKTCPEAFSAEFETGAVYNSVAKLLAHSIGAEERWQARLRDRPLPMYFEAKKKYELDRVFADAERVRLESRAIWNAADESERARRWRFGFGSFQGEMSVEETFFHVLHHETWHYGQIVSQLQRLGLDPPDCDFCYFKEAK